MSHCPSQDWDRYCRDNDAPETCVCGKDNSDENGEWVCAEHPGFCSFECYETHQKKQMESNETEAQYLQWVRENCGG
jgi:hypothetical protein